MHDTILQLAIQDGDGKIELLGVMEINQYPMWEFESCRFVILWPYLPECIASTLKTKEKKQLSGYKVESVTYYWIFYQNDVIYVLCVLYMIFFSHFSMIGGPVKNN